MMYRYIAIEGNIGSGKTTLARLLAEHYHATPVLEAFADNKFLPKFYDDPHRFALPLELSFLVSRQKQLKHALAGSRPIIADYMFIKSMLFAGVNLKDDEYAIFEELYQMADVGMPKPDVIIYLQSPVGQLQTNIRARARGYESTISDDYLLKLQGAYCVHMELETTPTLIIDAERTDFINNADQFSQLVDILNKTFTSNIHFPV